MTAGPSGPCRLASGPGPYPPGVRPVRPSRPLGVAALVLVLLGTAGVAGCGGGSGGGVAAGSAPDTTDPPTTATTATTAPTSSTVDPATLPQTDEKPAAGGEGFHARAAALWGAVVADDPSIAMPAFFPLAAYQQVKAIKDPAADWHTRLVAAYEADIHALHAELGGEAATAGFEGLSVPDAAVWVTPGKEYNKLPYWRVYGSSLDYSSGGVRHSLPVGSLISWRGQWYVVHLGGIR